MLIERVRRTIVERELFASTRSVLVACSGGPDSQVLLHVLAALSSELGVALHAASVDHGLRPDAAHDVAVAKALSDRLGVPFHGLSVQVPRAASRQAAARAARYEALRACAGEIGAQRIAVGHTLDDQAETVLARLLRGTGVEGLAGITPVRADGVVRPLLDARRRDVHGYAAREGLTVATDPSNADGRYLRVRIRAHLLPMLEVENPRLVEHLAALADDALAARSVLVAEGERALARTGGQVRALKEESPWLRRWALRVRVEREIAARLQRNHLVALERMLSIGGQVRLPGDFVASLDERGELVLSKVAKRGRGVRRPTPGTEQE